MLKYIFVNVKERKMRTAVMLLSILLSTTLLFVSFSIGASYESAQRKMARGMAGSAAISVTAVSGDINPHVLPELSSIRASAGIVEATALYHEEGYYETIDLIAADLTQSDVDIAVVQEEVFQTIYREGVSDSNYNFSTIESTPTSFKDEVEKCLREKFKNDVERKNKSIKVHGNTYRKDADTVPCRRYRDYRNDFYNNENNYIGGIVILADNGERIINYPEQHIANGKIKNAETNHYYKKMVRIIKKMRYLMEDNYISSAKEVSSFGLESLLWNLPNELFTKYSIYRYTFDDIVDYLYNNTYLLSCYNEANGIKPLCPYSSDVNKFTNFINDLKTFYEYDITED